MIKAVIFDFDGVLVNSPEIVWEERKKYLQEKYGIALKIQDIQEALGLIAEEQAVYLGKKYSIPIDVDAFVKQRQSLEPILEKKLKLTRGALELIKDLIKNKIKIAIATSKSHALVESEMKRFQLEIYFSVVVSKEDVKAHKPNPEVFLKAAEKLEAQPEECVVIEDAIHGIDAAKRAGMAAIGVCTPIHSKFPGADLEVHSLEELNSEKIKKLR